ncbi:acyl carrier protein [Fibrella sp. ES10-3-2-2]
MSVESVYTFFKTYYFYHYKKQRSVMKNQVISILNNFGIQESQVANDVHFTRDLGLDSLDTVDLVMQLEQEFGIRIPDEDYPKLLTFQGVLNYLEDQHVSVPA